MKLIPKHSPGGTAGKPNISISQTPVSQQALEDTIKKYLNIPYVWGGKDPNKGLDCVGFVNRIYRDLGHNVSLYNLKGYDKAGFQTVDKNNLQPGDVLQLAGTNKDWGPGKYSHAAIFMGYLPNGNWKVAETTGGGKNSRYTEWNPNKGYYAKHFMGAKRLFNLGGGQQTIQQTPKQILQQQQNPQQSIQVGPQQMIASTPKKSKFKNFIDFIPITSNDIYQNILNKFRSV